MAGFGVGSMLGCATEEWWVVGDYQIGILKGNLATFCTL